jgi:hypothetical protein
VEFYFSDSNLPKDKFMLEQVNGHPDHCESLSTAAATCRPARPA